MHGFWLLWLTCITMAVTAALEESRAFRDVSSRLLAVAGIATASILIGCDKVNYLKRKAMVVFLLASLVMMVVLEAVLVLSFTLEDAERLAWSAYWLSSGGSTLALFATAMAGAIAEPGSVDRELMLE